MSDPKKNAQELSQKELENSHKNEAEQSDATKKSKETGGPGGPEPTRYGDWERKGRCIDF